MSTGEEELVSIPNDLIVDILSRLPAESVARCRCLSKLWGSILHRAWSFYSLPQRRHDLYDDKAASPPLVAYPDFHMKFPEDINTEYNGFTSGLIYFSSMQITPESTQKEAVIFIPRTGQYATLPKLLRTRYGKIFLGFDPIGKQFKVLFIMTRTDSSDAHRILTLGNGIMKWRKIECPCSSLFRDHVTDEGICINGILYVLAKRPACYFQRDDVEIVCFDVRSEKFKSIDVERVGSCWDVKLVNYKGKLGVVTRKELYELRLSVLEDFDEKQAEWSKHVYTLPKNDIIDDPSNYFISGVTATGEIAFSRNHTSGRPFYVVYFSIESNTLRSVEIRGLESDHIVCAYVDLVEDLNVNDAMYFKSCPRLNGVITNIRPKPQERSNCVPSVKNNNQQSDKPPPAELASSRQRLLQNKFDMLANLDD
ncbi:putative F-box protein [Raphanus sativus]|nr:putative F-box protein [Raphanus sativus]